MVTTISERMINEVLSLEVDELAALRQNAKRYLKLRAMVRGERRLGDGPNQEFCFPSRFGLPPQGNIMRGSVAQHLDAAIDALPDSTVHGEDATGPQMLVASGVLAPAGWTFERDAMKRIVIKMPDGGGCVVDNVANDARHIPEEVLFALVKALGM
jgi:hypothetical protein